MSDLSVTERLLIAAAVNGDFEARESRGYDEDNKPEGWPVVVFRGTVVATDDEGRLSDLERDGYLDIPDVGLVTVTAAGRAVLQ